MNADEAPKEISASRGRRLARRLIERRVGGRAKRVFAKGGGLTNVVFEIDHPDGRFIVRLSPSPGKVEDFRKERWAIAQASAVGVPTPEVVDVGVDEGCVPYMIARKVKGEVATHHPRRLTIVADMGRMTAAVHTVRTMGFGHRFDWCKTEAPAHRSWRDYLDRELKVAERMRSLHDNRMLPPARLATLQAVMREVESWTESPVLHHGDMRLKNTVVDEAGRITGVIDWEMCVSSIAPYWDLSLALHDLSIDAKQAFVSGYGLSQAQLREIAPALAAFNVINYAGLVEEALRAGESERLEDYRTRLSGALDLFCL